MNAIDEASHPKMGDPAYGVMPDGTIVLGFVSALRRCSESYSVLGPSASDWFLDFQQAFENASERCRAILSDRSCSVAEHEKTRALLEAYENGPSSNFVPPIGDVVSVSNAVFFDTKKHVIRQEDLRRPHIPLNTRVWFMEDEWCLYSGLVGGIYYWTLIDGLGYTVETHTNIRPERIFTSKDEALNAMDRLFAEKLPGTLDRSRVEVRSAVTAEERDTELRATFSRLHERFRPAESA